VGEASIMTEEQPGPDWRDPSDVSPRFEKMRYQCAIGCRCPALGGEGYPAKTQTRRPRDAFSRTGVGRLLKTPRERAHTTVTGSLQRLT
jgi:hypothetical protein